MELPRANFTKHRGIFALGAIPLVIGILWTIYHIASVVKAMQGHGSPLATTFLVSLLLLWWVPLSWWEKPKTVTEDEQKMLDDLVVTVVIPAFDEKDMPFRTGLISVLTQSRLPNRVHVIDDGSSADYEDIKQEFLTKCMELGVESRWIKTVNRGKRHAQMESIANDDADIICTLDSDSTLDFEAINEGLKGFIDPEVMSVAGMPIVWNSRDNFLSRLTCILYNPFTRGFRSAQSVLGQVLVNSGTLAFYRGDLLRKYIGIYENEMFMDKPMQMNDDSMMTLYGLREGKTIHQPSSIAFTIVPIEFDEYKRQQLRWMRGTFVRSLWWMKELSPKRACFWIPIAQLVQFVMGIMVLPAMFVVYRSNQNVLQLLVTWIVTTLLLNYLVALRYFIIERSDESNWMQMYTFLLAPVAGVWRFFILRPLAIYAYMTFWKTGNWGTRQNAVEAKAAVN